MGWGEVINGGFGMLLDGSPDADRRLRAMLDWDVSNGLARRAWARNEGALYAVRRAMDQQPAMRVTLPTIADDSVIEAALAQSDKP